MSYALLHLPLPSWLQSQYMTGLDFVHRPALRAFSPVRLPVPLLPSRFIRKLSRHGRPPAVAPGGARMTWLPSWWDWYLFAAILSGLFVLWGARKRLWGFVFFYVGLLLAFFGLREPRNFPLVYIGLVLEFVGGGIMAWRHGREVKKSRSVGG